MLTLFLLANVVVDHRIPRLGMVCARGRPRLLR
jgi:hypothetical protein